jgi:rod shape-determining protein MreC
MPLGTLDRTPPPFFRQGPSAISRLAVLGALAIFLMVADVRFKVTAPIRLGVATALAPVQWLVAQPVRAVQLAGSYFQSLSGAQAQEAQARQKLVQMGAQALQVGQMAQENSHLRKLLELRERIGVNGVAAQVLYDAADPYSRKVVIDAGLTRAVALGSAVLDEQGVAGQVTRVYPQVSEVTLLTDRDQSIPVLNIRTGTRGIAFGDAADGLELRYVAANADVKEGDLLVTSGVDGVYPPGLPVAKVLKVDRRSDTSFARIQCQPAALTAGAVHVMVVPPVSAQIPQRPVDAPVVDTAKKGGKKPMPP